MKQYAVKIQVIDLEGNNVPIDTEMYVVAPDEVMALTASLYKLADLQEPQSFDRMMNTIQLVSR